MCLLAPVSYILTVKIQLGLPRCVLRLRLWSSRLLSSTGAGHSGHGCDLQEPGGRLPWVESGSASTRSRLGASLFSKILRNGDPPGGLKEGSHVLSSGGDPRRQWGRLPPWAFLPVQVGSDVASLRGPVCPHPNTTLTSPVLFICPHPKVICSDLVAVFPCFIYFFIFFGCPLGHVESQFHDWDLNLWPCVGGVPHASSRISISRTTALWGRIDYKQHSGICRVGSGVGLFIVGCGGVIGLNEVAQTHRTLYPKG